MDCTRSDNTEDGLAGACAADDDVAKICFLKTIYMQMIEYPAFYA
jgi:hypothetical protein